MAERIVGRRTKAVEDFRSTITLRKYQHTIHYFLFSWFNDQNFVIRGNGFVIFFQTHVCFALLYICLLTVLKHLEVQKKIVHSHQRKCLHNL